MKIEDLDREELLELLTDFSKRWLAHDGLWFQALERSDGMEKAMEIDRQAWKNFTVLEARRIMKFLGLEEGGGLDALEKSLNFRLYALVNEQSMERKGEDRLIFKMNNCRVQQARKRKKMDLFPCKSIGQVEYSGFAATIDDRIETSCLSCPPDPTPDEYYCAWEFKIST